jgi:Zn-dependent protease with chaperone function
MKRLNLPLLGIFFAIPIFAFVVATATELKLDPKSADDSIELIRSGSILAVVVGIALLGGIRLAGSVSRKRRRLLLLIFAPGLHLTMLTTSGLMVLYAGLAIGTIYYAESVFIGSVHIGVILSLALGALFGIVTLIKAQFGTLQKATTTALAKRLPKEEYPELWHFVMSLANEVKAECPKSIIAGLEPNFYVTEARVRCVDGTLSGGTMYISLPLCRILSLTEMKAVLAHELAHFRGLDTRFSKRFYPIYRGVSEALAGIASAFSDKGGVGQVVLLPTFVILTYFLACFSDAEAEISRERELSADAEASKAAGPSSIASALVKIHAFSQVWPAIEDQMKEQIAQGKVLVNGSRLFATIVNELDQTEAIRGLSQDGPSHPTDTHPALNVRLASLNLTVDQVTMLGLRVSPDPSAFALLVNGENVEAQLTEIEQALMIQRGVAIPNEQEAVASAS